MAGTGTCVLYRDYQVWPYWRLAARSSAAREVTRNLPPPTAPHHHSTDAPNIESLYSHLMETPA
ncbi:hypothetical protein E2C01_085904 [Portunus trituberculatus]|uniref:Uncharacterized protein n=1 Tax=Portunus trituberculatus TaxID=210409 RepID=A0A5B7J2A2_PORTR|nr:hypothetical protein [Portunus trituberculatus]